MKNTNSHSHLFEKATRITSQLSSPARLKILTILAQAPRSVEILANLTGESIANTSQHLQRLLKEDLIQVHKDKLQRIYELKGEQVALLIERVFDLAEFLSPHTQNMTEMISLETIFKDIASKKAVLLDVRDEEESRASPIEGALTLPHDKIEKHLADLKKTKTYYVFCRGRACGLASEAVMKLRSRGIKAFRLKESPVGIKELLSSEIA